ncbi:MAG TPA: phosphatidylglycerophosphatase A [Nautiliaceae bacterium]|nr:phosphatidylglycerophosphatase A [Nautiliaceae bacterium]
MKFDWFILTGFFSGLLPKAPGTWGSIVGCIIAYIVIKFFPTPTTTLWLLITLFTIIGIKLTDKYEQNGGEHDDKRIVIDEIVGVLIAISLFNNLKEDTLIKIFLAFVTFRFLDIYKPSIIGRIDQKLKGGVGVMVDDILAGIFGGILAGIMYMGYLAIIPT